MAPYKKPQLSILEQLFLILNILRALSTGLISLITGPFRGSTGTGKLTNHAKITTLRNLTRYTTTRSLQSFAPTLQERYLAYCQKKNLPPASITLSDGTKAFWLGSPEAENVLVFFHGGGYNLPPDPLHLSFPASLVRPPSSNHGSLSVLLLEYTLAPHATYPTQLREAVSLLHHLLTVLHFPPSRISLAGDSAGGNLALGVVGHVLHPHPDPSIPRLPASLGKGEKLAGLVLVAPWCSFAHHWPSLRTNAGKDIVGRYQSDMWSSTFLGGAAKDAYNEPLGEGEGEDWFEGLDGVVAEVLVTAGGDEVLRSSIEELVRRLRVGMWHGHGSGNGRVELVVGGGSGMICRLWGRWGGGGGRRRL